LIFRFTFVSRQTTAGQHGASPTANAATTTMANSDTSITGLTFAYASNDRDLENLVTREFHADPNLHKNSNVQLVGDFSTDGSQAVQFEWSWTWRPPKPSEDKGGGWRNSCSFLEYDQRAHRLHTLASFSFWVQNTQRLIQQTPLASPNVEMSLPPRLRVISSQSYQSRASEGEPVGYQQDPPSPIEPTVDTGGNSGNPSAMSAPLVDVSCQRPGEDMSAVEDGPLFRATMKSLEQKTGNMRTQMKKVLKKAEAAQQAQVDCNHAMKGFLVALKEASGSNASAIKPALDHYFNQIAQQILQYETQNSIHLQRQIIEPLSKLYNLDIKQAESKKKDFEDESRDYYAYVSRYLGQRQDSMKDKKRIESDNKYQTKRRNFELKRFDYSSFMTDLHGGRKEQELLSHLTRYADGQAKSFLATAKKIEEMSPQLHALVRGVSDADKEYKFQRTEREEKRRTLEKSTASYNEPANTMQSSSEAAATPTQNGYHYTSDSDLGRADSTSSQLAHSLSNKSGKTLSPSNSTLGPPPGSTFSTSPSGTFISPGQNRFKGIRDLEESQSITSASDKSGGTQHRKEGLLWALSRPGSHIDPKGINKQAWHKYIYAFGWNEIAC
jgi:Arf-GAP with SH3 domain, ANK repeat and PH domain-containing protein